MLKKRVQMLVQEKKLSAQGNFEVVSDTDANSLRGGMMAASCPGLAKCGTYNGDCPSLTNCGTFDQPTSCTSYM